LDLPTLHVAMQFGLSHLRPVSRRSSAYSLWGSPGLPGSFLLIVRSGRIVTAVRGSAGYSEFPANSQVLVS